MTFQEFISTVAVGSALISLVLTFLAYRRTGKWRETDEGKLLVAKVDSHGIAIGRHGEKLEALKNDIKDLPTKADLTKLEGMVGTLTEISKRTEKNVDRLLDSALEHT